LTKIGCKSTKKNNTRKAYRKNLGHNFRKRWSQFRENGVFPADFADSADFVTDSFLSQLCGIVA